MNTKLFELGVREVEVHGIPNTDERRRAISSALEKFKNDPLSSIKFGVKKYSIYGEQSFNGGWHDYPFQGELVFSIKRRKIDIPVSSAGIYALDFLLKTGNKSYDNPNSTPIIIRPRLNIVEAYFIHSSNFEKYREFMDQIKF